MFYKARLCLSLTSAISVVIASPQAYANDAWRTDSGEAKKLLTEPRKLDQANALLKKAWDEVSSDEATKKHPAFGRIAYIGILADFETLAKKFDDQKQFEKSTSLWKWIINSSNKVDPTPVPHAQIWLANSYIVQGKFAAAEKELVSSEATMKTLEAKPAINPSTKLLFDTTNIELYECWAKLKKTEKKPDEAKAQSVKANTLRKKIGALGTAKSEF